MLRSSQVCLYARGIIGLGAMGSRMCRHLVGDPSIPLYAFDASAAALDTACALGARRCSSPAEVAQKASIIVTMLPNAHILRSVCLDPETGIFRGALDREATTEEPETMVVDSSTIGPTAARDFAQLAQSKGIVFLDAPVSGGIAGAAAGTLTFMLGAAEQKQVEVVKEKLLNFLGKSVVHCGPVGTGQVAKLCNNAVLGQHMVAATEAMALGKQLGISLNILTECINQSTGASWSTQVNHPVPGIDPKTPSSNNYQDGFQVQLIEKDLALARAEAQAVGVSVPGMDLAFSKYNKARNAGRGSLDFGSIYLDHQPTETN